MSNLEVLIADGNSAAARRARVKLQPRDKKGRWVPTGAALLAMIRDLSGTAKKYKLKAIGGTATKKGEKNKIRALVTEDIPELKLRKNTVVELDPAATELDTQIKLDRDFLERKGIDPDLQHTLPKGLGQKYNKLEDLNPKRADDLDIELATGGLTDEEDKDFRAERDQEPLAKLPPGMEELSEDELDALTRGGPKAPSAVEKPDTKPPRFPGDKGVPEPTDVSGKPKPPTLVDHRDSIMQKAMADAFYGDKPDIDVVLNTAKKAEPEEVGIADLKPGDVVALGGGPRVVTRVEKKTRLDGSEGYNLYVDDNGREAKVNPGGQLLPGSAGVVRIRKAEDAPKKPVTDKPDKPEGTRKPTPKKTDPAPKKTDPAPEKTKPVPKKAPKAENVAKKNRKDDGKPIKPSSKSREELYEKKINNLVDEDGKLLKVTKDNGKEVVIEDPNAIVNALLEENPNAKIKENGAIVLERGSFTDTDGKKYNYEVAVERTVGNQFMERYTISDPKTGEALYDFYNADYKDSFRGLYGKTSGLTKTRDYLLGKDAPGGGLDEDGIPAGKNRKELSTYFGPDKTIENRLKYLRKGKDPKNWRLLTIDENFDKFLEGRDRELNKSDQADGKNYKSQFGNVKRSFIGSIYEAIELDDRELLKERLVQALGRTPDNEESINKIIDRMKAGIDERYKGTPRHKQLAFLPLQMQKFLEDEQADLRARSNVPFISEDGVTPVVPGDRVRFINNEGDMVVGEVVKLNAGSGVNGGYKDTARVKFGDQIVDNLQTRNMLHTDEEVTEYAQWVRGDEKLKRRAEELGIDFEEYKRRKEDNPDFSPDDPEESISDAGAPYIPEGESAEESSAPESAPEPAEQPEAPAPSNTRIKPGRVRIENSDLAAKYTRQDAADFVESGEAENEKYVKVSSSSRKEKAALKPTPQAVELKDELVTEGLEVVKGLEDSKEYSEKLAEFRKFQADSKKNEEAFISKLQELKKKSDEARKNYNDVRDKALADIEDPQERDDLMMRFNYNRDYTGFPEVEKVAKQYLAAQDEYDAHALTRTTYTDNYNKTKGYISELSVITRNYVKAELEKQGVEFGGYTTEDLVDRGVLVFTGPVKAKSAGAKNERPIQRKYQEQFDEILSSIPKGVIESIFFSKTTSRRNPETGEIIEKPLPLRVGVGKARGHYVTDAHYTVLNVEENIGGRENSIFDVGIHELWHAAQTNNADISALEHAWMYGRAMGDTSAEMGSPFTENNERFLRLAKPTAESYTARSYSRGNVLFAENNGASEVATTLMQGLWSNMTYLGFSRSGSDVYTNLDADALAFAIGLMLGSAK